MSDSKASVPFLNEQAVEAAARAMCMAESGDYDLSRWGDREDKWAEEKDTWRYRAEQALVAALPHLTPPARTDEVSGWRAKSSLPKETGAEIVALVQTELVREEFVPAALMGGWRRSAEPDLIVGWLPKGFPLPVPSASPPQTSQQVEPEQQPVAWVPSDDAITAAHDVIYGEPDEKYSVSESKVRAALMAAHAFYTAPDQSMIIDKSVTLPEGSPPHRVTQEHYDGVSKQVDDQCVFMNNVAAALGLSSFFEIPEEEMIARIAARAVAPNQSAEIESLKAEFHQLFGQFEDERSQLTAARAEIERLVEALEFYADPEIYRPHPNGLAFDHRDLSYHARTALASASRFLEGQEETDADV